MFGAVTGAERFTISLLPSQLVNVGSRPETLLSIALCLIFKDSPDKLLDLPARLVSGESVLGRLLLPPRQVLSNSGGLLDL